MTTPQTSAASVLISGIFALILTMGIARFAYTPMLPYMQSQTGLGEALAGWLAGWNYLGYMLGVLIITRIKRFSVKDRVYRYGLMLAVVTTPMMGISASEYVWGVSRFLAGLSTAAGLMLGSGLILNWLMRAGHRSELGIHFSGIGIGIAVGAIIIEVSSASLDWQSQWFLLGLVSVVLLIPALKGLPRANDDSARVPQSTGRTMSTPAINWLLPLHIAYFCAGFSYVVYSTFIVIIAEQQLGLAASGVWIWCISGLAAIPSAIIWDRVARKAGHVHALMLAYGLNMIALILPIISNHLMFAILSAILFGLTFVGIVSLVLTMVGIRYPATPAQIMAKLTLSYCVAQITGPVIAGEMAERSGHFTDSIILALILMLLGICVLWRIRE